MHDCPEREMMQQIVSNRAEADALRHRKAQAYEALHHLRRKVPTSPVLKGIADTLDEIALIDEQLDRNRQ